MIIRKYNQKDCKQLAALFYDTVHTVNAKDYTKEQLDAWAPQNPDLTHLNKSFLKNYTVVAVIDNTITGFGNISQSGYIDMLYIHKDYQRQHIAAEICNTLETSINSPYYEVHASISAKAFFEKRGYRVVKEQNVERGGILLKNFVMMK